VLAALPKSAHPGAKRALAEIYNAENKALSDGTGSLTGPTSPAV
jgi:hypothetical protein